MIIIFSCIDKMGNYEPTTFFILENEELGTWWVGKKKMELDAMDFPARRSVSQSELLTKLEKKFETHHKYTRPSLDIRFLNSSGFVSYGIERFLSKLDYKIRKDPQMYEELRKLYSSGWTNDDFTMPSTLHVLHIWNPNKLTNINDVYSDLKENWGTGGEGQLRSFHKLNKCLNERISKPKDEYLYQKARAKLLREMKKTGKRPKQSTIDKYKITPEEILDIKKMSEDQLVMEEARGIIYKISSPSGNIYVGQTIRSFEQRIKEHKNPKSRCTAVRNAIQKYGDEMKYEIIEDNIPHKQLNDREIHWIKELNSLRPNGYNLNSGGNANHIIAQEAKDRIQMGKIKSKVERDGYMGDIRKYSNDTMFYPRIRRRGKHISLSTGGFRTEEEAIEVLREYTRDPENFTVVDNRHISSVGSVYPTKSRLMWILEYKTGNYLGTYKTQEEAWKALERYIEDPVNFSREHRKIGSVRPKGNKWKVSCKCEYLGSYTTEEEGYKALDRYLKDPDTKVYSIANQGKRWRLKSNGIIVKFYDTREEAEEARQALQSSL